MSNGDGFGKNVMILVVDNKSFVHADKRQKNILIIGEGPKEGLHYTTKAAETKYSTNLTEWQNKLCLSLHYNGSNSSLFVNTVKIYQLKAKDSKINSYL